MRTPGGKDGAVGGYPDALSPCAPLRVSGAEQGGSVLRLQWRDPVRLRGLSGPPRAWYRTSDQLCEASVSWWSLHPVARASLPPGSGLRPNTGTSHRTARGAVFRLGLRDWPVPPPLARAEFKKKSFCRQPRFETKMHFLKKWKTQAVCAAIIRGSFHRFPARAAGPTESRGRRRPVHPRACGRGRG